MKREKCDITSGAPKIAFVELNKITKRMRNKIFFKKCIPYVCESDFKKVVGNRVFITLKNSRSLTLFKMRQLKNHQQSSLSCIVWRMVI